MVRKLIGNSHHAWLVASQNGTDDPSGPPVLAPDPSPTGWSLPGDLPVDEVERLIGRSLPAGDYQTLAGLAIARCGGFPRVGYRIEVPLPPALSSLAAVLDEQPPAELLWLRVDEVARHVPSRITLTVIDSEAGKS